jgi:hypothetical protein
MQYIIELRKRVDWGYNYRVSNPKTKGATIWLWAPTYKSAKRKAEKIAEQNTKEDMLALLTEKYTYIAS